MKKLIFLIFAFSLAASAQSNISPNMGMPVPIPGITSGPQWALDINSSLGIIDVHNHSPGYGVQINPNGININADLPFNGYNAKLLKSTRFSPQSVVLTGANVGAIYVVGNELYYNDVTGGNKIQITSNGSVNAGAGSISGLPSGTASASYSASTFTFQSATNTAANVDGRNFILRNSSASSKGLTLQPPAAMGSNISETLPTIPVSTKIMEMDSSGNMSAVVVVDNATIQLSGNTLSLIPASVTDVYLSSSSVTTAKIVDSAVTTAKIADSNVTRAKLVSVGQQISSSSGNFTTLSTSYVDVTNLSISITTTGRPVQIMLISAGSGAQSQVAAGDTPMNLRILRGVSEIAEYRWGTSQGYPSSSVNFLDAPSAGTYTYKIQIKAEAGVTTANQVLNAKLAVYEL